MATPISVVDEPVLPGPEPILPGPDPIPPTPDPRPGPDPPFPPPLPDPAPQPAPDDPDVGSISVQADVVIELCGSLAVVSGVVGFADERAPIVDEIASLWSTTRVESTLRPPAA